MAVHAVGANIRSLYGGMVRIVVTPTWAKLIDFETTLRSAEAARSVPNLPERDHLTRQAARLNVQLRG